MKYRVRISKYRKTVMAGCYRGAGKPALVYLSLGSIVLAAAECDRPGDMATYVAVERELRRAE
jgi:hypothetical protein